MTQLTETDIQNFQQTFQRLLDAVHSVVIGQREPVFLTVAALFARGHVLIEGNPGTSKTTLARAFARALGLTFVRVQGTPDLMPADIVGHEIFNPNSGRFEERQGPILQGQLILVDEINRMTPKTQSATLEALQEGTVTFAGKKHLVQEPFMALATMNPIEQEGTYPLPEAQQDRFLVKVLMERPTVDELIRICALPGQDKTDEKLDAIRPVIRDGAEIRRYQDMVDQVELGDHMRTIARIIDATSPLPAAYSESAPAPQAPRDYLRYGGSPRGIQALVRLARVAALTEGAAHVSRSNIERVLTAALRHRVLLRYEYALRRRPDELLLEVFQGVTGS